MVYPITKAVVCFGYNRIVVCFKPVSYTHLDVYKRQTVFLIIILYAIDIILTAEPWQNIFGNIDFLIARQVEAIPFL